MFVLRALPRIICGCMASRRVNSGKRHVMLVQCVGLICIISDLRYSVVMLTVQALRTSASDTYPVDCGDKPRVWPSMGQKSHTRAYMGLIRECVTPALGPSYLVGRVLILNSRDRGNYSHFLDHKRPTQTPRVKYRSIEFFVFDLWFPSLFTFIVFQVGS